MLKTQLKFLITIVLVLGFSISLQSLLATWQGPTAGPPSLNIDRPINTGLTAQTKSGALTVIGDLGVASSTIILGDIIVGGSISGNGANILGVEWNNISSKPLLQKALTQSCATGSSIRSINSNGTVVCEIDSGASTTFNDCFYAALNMCPSNTLMRGTVSGQAYCCGSTPTSCTATTWATYSSYCAACGYKPSCTAGAYAGNYLTVHQKRTLSSCLIENQTLTNYAYCSNYCYDTCPPPGPLGSTPYLFAYVNGQYLIQSDVMITYFDQFYENAKNLYEDDNGSKKVYQITDYYVMRLSPEVNDDKIKIMIKELEPEESSIDEVKLLQVTHKKGSKVIIDHQKNEVLAVKKEMSIALDSCKSKLNGCKEKLAQIDQDYIEGEKGDVLDMSFDIKNLKGKRSFFVMNSWGSDSLKPALNPLEAYSQKSFKTFFDLDNNGEYVRLKDVHPRELESDSYLDVSDLIQKIKGDYLNVRLEWTADHALDYIALMNVEETTTQIDELKLSKAEHSKNNDVITALSSRDYDYAHTVRGDSIELEFLVPEKKLAEDMTETYVFVSSGFYNGLRTYLYPEIDSTDSYVSEITEYVSELKKYMKSEGLEDNVDMDYYYRQENNQKSRQDSENLSWVTKSLSSLKNLFSNK